MTDPIAFMFQPPQPPQAWPAERIKAHRIERPEDGLPVEPKAPLSLRGHEMRATRQHRQQQILDILRREGTARMSLLRSEVGVSEWTVYMEIKELRVLGWPIVGRSGAGYWLEGEKA